MTAVNVQTASSLYSITGVGYAPAGSITRTVAGAPAPAAPPAGADGSTAAAVAAATAAMAAKGPASAAAGPGGQQELSEGELAALKLLLEGAVLCNDSNLNVVTDEATGGLARCNGTTGSNALCMCGFSFAHSCTCIGGLVRCNGTTCSNALCMCGFSFAHSCIDMTVQRELVVFGHYNVANTASLLRFANCMVY
jgi:hypothetical protein